MPPRRRHPCHLLCPQLQTRSVRKDYDPKGGFRFYALCLSDLCLFPGWLAGLVIGTESPCVVGLTAGRDLVICGALAQHTGPVSMLTLRGSGGIK